MRGTISMRTSFVFVMAAALGACGVFGSVDPAAPADEPLPPPSTPEGNAEPPPPAVGGEAPAGVFVSSSIGADDASGASTRPVKTLAKAMLIAKERGIRVIACAEAYEETLTLVDGVSIYGYYDCKATPWKRGTARAVVSSKTSPAMVARNIGLATRIEGFEVRAPDLDGAPATDEAGSSIALLLEGSRGLVFGEGMLHAGKGANGADGAEASANTFTASHDGKPGVGRVTADDLCNYSLSTCLVRPVTGPAGGASSCSVGATGAGGAGGDGSWYSGTGGYKSPASWNGKPGGGASAAPGGSSANRGTDGAPAGDGTDGSNGVWSFAGERFVRGNGVAGSGGAPGNGGGGGGGSRNWEGALPGLPATIKEFSKTSTGGSGGAGGCPGLASKAGEGGAASIGVLSIASEIRFEKSRIETSAGGKAGRGFFGGNATIGGTGGAAAIYSGAGGDGSAGGYPGYSGHGAPGPSIALVYSGAKPVVEEVEIVPGPAGAGWPEAQKVLGATTKVLPAVVGESKAEHAIVP